MAVGSNPLRGPSDWFESWVHRLLTVVLVLGLPLAAVGAGLTAYESTMRTVHAQTAQRHEVTARLTSNVAGGSDVAKESARVRWMEQNGTVRTGTTLVKPGTPLGTTLRIWVSPDGTITSPPANATTAWSNGFFLGIWHQCSSGTVPGARGQGIPRFMPPSVAIGCCRARLRVPWRGGTALCRHSRCERQASPRAAVGGLCNAWRANSAECSLLPTATGTAERSHHRGLLNPVRPA